MAHKQTRKLVGGLLKVFAYGTVLAVGVVAPNALELIESITKLSDRETNRSEYRRLLRYMKHLDLISIDHLADGGTYVSLTKKGEQRLQDVYIEDVIIKHTDRWDDKWRVVAFDIPRDKKRERNEFLSQLHRLGFIRTLQSMWVYPFPCTEEVYAIANLIGIEKNVMVFEAIMTKDQHIKLIKSFKEILPK